MKSVLFQTGPHWMQGLYFGSERIAIAVDKNASAVRTASIWPRNFSQTGAQHRQPN
jgi:hypothetical protein